MLTWLSTQNLKCSQFRTLSLQSTVKRILVCKRHFLLFTQNRINDCKNTLKHSLVVVVVVVVIICNNVTEINSIECSLQYIASLVLLSHIVIIIIIIIIIIIVIIVNTMVEGRAVLMMAKCLLLTAGCH